MKTLVFIILLASLATGTSATAQRPQGRTVEERVKAIHEKIDSAFKPDAAKLSRIDSLLADFYRSADKVREDLRSGGGRPDPQAMREKMQPLTEARDKELQAVLGDDDFKIWKEVIEPSMRPQRPDGGNR